MSTYEICNRHSGLVLGVYEGATEADALDALARDAGYADHAAALAASGGTADDLIVTQVQTQE